MAGWARMRAYRSHGRQTDLLHIPHAKIVLLASQAAQRTRGEGQEQGMEMQISEECKIERGQEVGV